MTNPMNYKQAHDIVCAVADFGINSEEVVLGLGAGPNVIIQALCTTALSSTPKPPTRVADLPTSLPPTAKPSHEEIGPVGPVEQTNPVAKPQTDPAPNPGTETGYATPPAEPKP